VTYLNHARLGAIQAAPLNEITFQAPNQDSCHRITLLHGHHQFGNASWILGIFNWFFQRSAPYRDRRDVDVTFVVCQHK
jgi:hypothetical protein